jgi:CDP-diacylglycerol--serine O-phosphatidyltransferase
MRAVKTIAVLPTLLTVGNLICGFFAIVIAARVEAPRVSMIDVAPRVAARTMLLVEESDPTNIMLSALLIFLAMIFDAADGHVARLSGTDGEFGKQLDSLCDMVTFGVAPAFLLVKMCPNFTYLHRETVWVIAALYAACVALRLARFNVESTQDDDHMHFSGLPSPAGAAAVASFAIMFYSLRKGDTFLAYAEPLDRGLQAAMPFFALLVAVLMVSRIPYPHVVNQLFRGRRSLDHVVKILLVGVLLAAVRGYALPLVFGAFVLGAPLRFVWEVVVLRRPQDEPIF